MSLSIACSSCGAKVRAPNKAAGHSFKCPKCGDVLRAPASAPPLPPQRKATPQVIAVNCPHCKTKLSVEAGSAERMASCPMCGGTFSLTDAGGMSSSQTPQTAEWWQGRDVASRERPTPQTPQEEPNLPHFDSLGEPETRESQEPESGEQESLYPDHEPWFYAYLEKYAKSLQMLVYVFAVGCAVFTTIGFVEMFLMGMKVSSELGVSNGISAMTVLLSILAWILCLIGIMAALRLCLVGVAAILLAVDAARNLRAMKTATTAETDPK